MAAVGEALHVAEAGDLVAGVHVERAEETMIPQNNMWLKGTVQSSATPFIPMEMINSLKDT